MIRRAILSAALFALALPSAVHAAAVEEKEVLSGKVKRNPELGYIYLHAENRLIGQFLRVPDEDDRKQFEQDWRDGLAKAREQYTKDLARWEKDAAMAAKTKSCVRDKPVEPTEESYSIGTLEARGLTGFGPTYMFAKTKAPERFSYMQAVRPGTYVYYGPVNWVEDIGLVGACYCMGSVRFEVKAGTIANLGNFLTVAPKIPAGWPATAIPEQRTLGSGFGFFLVNAPDKATETNFDLPASLKDWPSEVPDFRAAGKMNNFNGVTITRMPPVPGVLAYDRDRVIDVKGEAGAAR